MPSNLPALVIDTNVWLDLFIPGRPGAGASAALLEYAVKEELPLAFASQSALDVYHNVQRDQKHWLKEHGALTEDRAKAIKGFAWDCVSRMQDVATPVPVDRSDFYRSCRARDYHDDLEDDLIIATCERAEADYLVTNDRKLLAHSPVEAKTPVEMLRLLKAGLADARPSHYAEHNQAYWFNSWMSSYE